MGTIYLNMFSSEDMRNKKDQAESSLKDQLSSIPIDTFLSEPMKMFESTNLSQSNNSKPKSQELKDSDLVHGLLFFYSTYNIYPKNIISWRPFHQCLPLNHLKLLKRKLFKFPLLPQINLSFLRASTL